MPTVDLPTLLRACSPGGASVLTSRTSLEPAAGPLGGIAPARFVSGNNGTYAYETRFDGEISVSTVVIDSKGSAINRVEAALADAIDQDHPTISLTPRIRVTYPGLPPASCLQVPHRAWDAHFRVGTIDGVPTTAHPDYVAARNSTHANAKPLLELSPASLVFGSWDSTRPSRQARFRSALVGEIVGILADQGPDGSTPPKRGAARKDEIAPSVRLRGPDLASLVESQQHELSSKNAEKIQKQAKNAKQGVVSASGLGLGAIPPSMDSLGFVSCRDIWRHHVLSFSALRQFRFGLGMDGDVAARALLAALALSGLARSDAELQLRANCDLRESGPSVVELDARYGDVLAMDPLTVEATDGLLEEAVALARSGGVRWDGQILEVVGNPLVAGGIVAETDDEIS